VTENDEKRNFRGDFALCIRSFVGSTECLLQDSSMIPVIKGIKWDGKVLRYFAWKVCSLRSDATGPIALVNAFCADGEWDTFFTSPLSEKDTRAACSTLNRACDGLKFCPEYGLYVRVILEGRCKVIREKQIEKREEERNERRQQNRAT